MPERGRSPALHRPSPPATQGLGLQLSATPIPFPHPPGLPTSRLQDSGLLKTEKSTSQHVFHFGFANAALSRAPVLPASIHFSSFILYPLSCLLSCILASRGPWSLTPVLQISWSSYLIANLSLARGFGVLLGLSPTFDLESASPFRALLPPIPGTAIPRSPFRPFQSKVLLSVTDHTGPCPVPVCSRHTHRHHRECQGGPRGAGRL